MDAIHRDIYETNVKACKQCMHSPKELGYWFQPSDSWIFAHLETRQIHLHPGITHSDQEHIEEAQFYEQSITSITQQHPNTDFLLVLDLMGSDESEAPTKTALDTYKQILHNPQIKRGIIYGATPGMKMLTEMLLMLTGITHFSIANTREEAERLIEGWEQNTPRHTPDTE